MRYELLVASGARRALEKMPAPAAHAVVRFITGPLLDEPRRVGKPLRDEFSGLFSARVGQYRVLYEIAEAVRVVAVIRIAHRASTYRPR